MKKLLLFVFVAILPAIAFSQYLSKEFTLDDSDVTTAVAISVSVSNEVSRIVLPDSYRTSGVFVSGCANLANDDDSYVRITLKDTDSNEYLIYELFPLLSETKWCPFSKIGLESAYLDNIHPQSIRIETLNASVTLDSIYFVVPERSSRNMSKAIPNRRFQCEHIANRLNERLVSAGKTWRAGVTFVSQMTFEEKKWLMGKNAPVLYGFDYYKGGVFVMPGYEREISRTGNTRTSDNYVTEWDWRNRHGKNWVTSVKYQGTCASCWAFSAIGTFESYINLYYNQLLNYDLSEQEIVSCAHAGNCENGGYLSISLAYINSSGVIPEDCFRYTATNDTCERKCSNPSDRLSFEHYINTNTTDEDSIKRMLFKSPICFGIRPLPWWHFVVLVGFRQIEGGEYYYTVNNSLYKVCISENNPLVGHPAWLIKNSWGTDWGDSGFGYVAMSLSNAYEIYKLSGSVFSQELNDNDIVCEDVDGDGYFNWGLGQRPSSCPTWANEAEDGDDSNYTKGSIDMYGNLQTIGLDDSDTIFVNMDDSITYSIPKYTYKHIKVCGNANLTISSQLFCYPGVSITIESNCKLIVSGGMINNVILKPQYRSSIVIERGGRIKHNKDINFQIPAGVTFKQNWGTIE